MSEPSSDSTEPANVKSPFTLHAACDHPLPRFSVAINKTQGLDLLMTLAYVDQALASGDIKSARKTLWAAGHLLDMVACGEQEEAGLLMEVAAQIIDEERDEEVRRLLDQP